jgi:hypothetical protein
MDDLDEFRLQSPPAWIDLHELAKVQIQTEGPLGLKQLAGASAGFQWRDVNPSGEASMLWYEVATRGDDPTRRDVASADPRLQRGRLSRDQGAARLAQRSGEVAGAPRRPSVATRVLVSIGR